MINSNIPSPVVNDVINARKKYAGTLISRRQIEDIIQDSPLEFPHINIYPSVTKRNFITKVMNKSFPPLKTGKKVKTPVWILSSSSEASHATV